MYVYRRPPDYAQRSRGAQTNRIAQFYGVTQVVNATLATGTFQGFSALVESTAPVDQRGSTAVRPASSAVFRRPWDYAQRRERIGRVQRLTTIGATTAAVTSVTYAATITSDTPTDARGSTSVRSPASYVFRKPWRYAAINSRVDITYITDFTGSVAGSLGTAAFQSFFAATGLTGVNVNGRLATLSSVTYQATLESAPVVNATRATLTTATYRATVVSDLGSATTISVTLATGAWTTYQAETVFRINFSAATGAFAGYTGTITSSRAVGFFTGYATFDTRPATIVSTFGLGLSRVGDVSARATGTYTPATVKLMSKRGKRLSITKEITKRK